MNNQVSCGIPVESNRNRPLSVGTGTLYDNLRKQLDRGIVEEPSPRASVDDHDLASASRESREFCLNFMNSTYGSIPPDVVISAVRDVVAQVRSESASH